ncbi:beta strand repeat-containing protein, partial [Planctomycetota bacterium]
TIATGTLVNQTGLWTLSLKGNTVQQLDIADTIQNVTVQKSKQYAELVRGLNANTINVASAPLLDKEALRLNTYAVTVAEDFLMSNGVVVAGGSNAISVGGTWERRGGGGFTAVSSTVTFTGTNSRIGGSEATTFYNLAVPSEKVLTISMDTDVSGELTVQSKGKVNLGSNRLSLAGQDPFSSVLGTVDATDGTVAYTGTNPTVSSISYGTLELNGSGTYSLPSSSGTTLTVSRSLQLKSGTLSVQDNTIDVGDNVEIDGGTTLNVGTGTSGAITLEGDWIMSATSTLVFQSGAKATFDGAENSTLKVIGGGTATFTGALGVNKISGTAIVFLGSGAEATDLVVGEQLDLQRGILYLNDRNVAFTESGAELTVAFGALIPGVGGNSTVTFEESGEINGATSADSTTIRRLVVGSGPSDATLTITDAVTIWTTGSGGDDGIALGNLGDKIQLDGTLRFTGDGPFFENVTDAGIDYGNSSEVMYDDPLSAVVTLPVSPSKYGSLTVDPGNDKQYALSGNLSLSGNLTIVDSNGVDLNTSGNTITWTGSATTPQINASGNILDAIDVAGTDESGDGDNLTVSLGENLTAVSVTVTRGMLDIAGFTLTATNTDSTGGQVYLADNGNPSLLRSTGQGTLVLDGTNSGPETVVQADPGANYTFTPYNLETLGNVSLNAAGLTVDGALTVATSSTARISSGGATLSVTGQTTVNGTLNSDDNTGGGITVTMNCNGGLQVNGNSIGVGAGDSFDIVVVGNAVMVGTVNTGGGSLDVTSGGDLTVSGSLNTAAGAITVSGDLWNSGGVDTTGSLGVTGTLNSSGTLETGAATIDGLLTLTGPATASGTVRLASGASLEAALTASAQDVYATGTVTVKSGGALTAGSLTVVGDVETKSGAGAVALTMLTVSGDVTSAATLQLEGADIERDLTTTAGTFTISGAAGRTIAVAGHVNLAGALNAATSFSSHTLQLDGTGGGSNSQTITTTVNLPTVEKANGGEVRFENGASATVEGALKATTDEAVVNIFGASVTVWGSATTDASATIKDSGAGTLTMAGGSSDLGGAGMVSLNNLATALDAAATLTLTTDVTVSGNVDIANNGNANTLKTGANKLEVGGTLKTFASDGTLEASSGDGLKLSIVDNQGTFSAPSGSATVSGTFTNTGTFKANDGTVVFSGGSSQTLAVGTSTPAVFYNVNITGVEVNANQGATFTGTVNVTGGLLTVSGGDLDLSGGPGTLVCDKEVTFTGDGTNALLLGGGTISGIATFTLADLGFTETDSGVITVTDFVYDNSDAGDPADTYTVAARFYGGNLRLKVSGADSTTYKIDALPASASAFSVSEDAEIGANVTVATGTMNAPGTIVFNGDLTVTGELNARDFATIELGGSLLGQNYMLAGANATHKLVLDGQSGTQLLEPDDYDNLEMGESANAAKLTTNPKTIYGDLTVKDGTLSADAAQVTAIDIQGKLSIQGGTFEPTMADLEVQGDVTVSGGSYQAESTVLELSGTLTLNDQTAKQNFGDTKITGTVDLNSPAKFANLTLSGTLKGLDNTITVEGNWDASIGSPSFQPGNGAVIFSGTTAPVSIKSGGQEFKNVTIQKSPATARVNVQSQTWLVGGDLVVIADPAPVSSITEKAAPTRSL